MHQRGHQGRDARRRQAARARRRARPAAQDPVAAERRGAAGHPARRRVRLGGPRRERRLRRSVAGALDGRAALGALQDARRISVLLRARERERRPGIHPRPRHLAYDQRRPIPLHATRPDALRPPRARTPAQRQRRAQPQPAHQAGLLGHRPHQRPAVQVAHDDLLHQGQPRQAAQRARPPAAARAARPRGPVHLLQVVQGPDGDARPAAPARAAAADRVVVARHRARAARARVRHHVAAAAHRALAAARARVALRDARPAVADGPAAQGLPAPAAGGPARNPGFPAVLAAACRALIATLLPSSRPVPVPAPSPSPCVFCFAMHDLSVVYIAASSRTRLLTTCPALPPSSARVLPCM